jgi:pimeloyl-ACP methyl ester carboxylesterase
MNGGRHDAVADLRNRPPSTPRRHAGGARAARDRALRSGAAPVSRPGSGEPLVFGLATVLLLVHALDDAFVHRGPGLGLGQHALAGAIALAAGVAAVLAFPSLRPGLRAALAFAFGGLACVNGLLHVVHVAKFGAGGASLRAVQLRPALSQRASRAHRRGHRAATGLALQRARVPRAPVRRRAAQHLRPPGPIAAPTLVVHGRHDRMVPVGNGERLAERIPGARLRILEESGHLYPTEEPAVDAEIAAFLADQGEDDPR